MRDKYGSVQGLGIGVCVMGILATMFAGGVDGAEPETQFDVKRAPWPCFRGPYGNGSAPVQGLELVDDLADAKLAWKSEDRIPPSSPWPGWHRYACSPVNIAKRAGKVEGVWSGGYATPIVAEGCVFVPYWLSAGRDDSRYLDEEKARNKKSSSNPVGKDKPADDVLHCFDAAAGTTRWRAVLAGRGRANKGRDADACMTCAWWDGTVFVPGTGEHLYAIDAANGKELWEARFPRASKENRKGGRSACAAVSGGVVVCGEDSLTAWDCKTGEDLWRGVGKEYYAVPVAWQKDGVAYFVVSGKLIEARTGKVRWSIPDPGESSLGDSVHGEYLVMSHRKHPGALAKQGVTCFRITPDACEEIWQHTWHYKPNINRVASTVVADGRVYALDTPDPAKSPVVGCIDLATGKRRGKGIKVGWRASLWAEGRIVAPHYEAVGYLHADADRYGLLAPNSSKQAEDILLTISDMTFAAYARGKVFFRQTQTDGQANLVCYDLRAAANSRSPRGNRDKEGRPKKNQNKD